MNFTLRGKIEAIMPVREVSASFKVREFVLNCESDNPLYPNSIAFQFSNDKCAFLDQFNLQDEVEVIFNIRGRRWDNPNGDVRYFNTLNAWRLTKVSQLQAGAVPPQQYQQYQQPPFQQPPYPQSNPYGQPQPPQNYQQQPPSFQQPPQNYQQQPPNFQQPPQNYQQQPPSFQQPPQNYQQQPPSFQQPPQNYQQQPPSFQQQPVQQAPQNIPGQQLESSPNDNNANDNSSSDDLPF